MSMTLQEIKQQKELEKRQRAVVQGTTRRIMSQFNFGKIHTWLDVYAIEGYNAGQMPANFSDKAAFADVKKYCHLLEEKLEQTIKEKYEEQNRPVHVPTGVPVSGGTESTVGIPSTGSSELAVVSQPAHFQPAQAVSTDESGFNNSNDYGLQPSDKEKAFLFWFQKKCVKEAFDKIVVEKKPAILILASTGTGKTYMQGALDRRLQDVKFADSKTWGHVKYLAITRNSVVEQTKRVLQSRFGINPVVETEVLNIEKLRTRAGQMWLDNIQTIVDGEEHEIWKWKQFVNPAVIYLDECQAVKNQDSTQHKILLAFSQLPNTTQVFISATPFTRVSEAKAFAVATHKDISHLGFPAGTLLTEQTWGTYSQAISHPSPPDEYNEAAVERLMKDLDDYIVRVKGVRWQFNAQNAVEIIDFENREQAKEYSDAWEKYLAKKAKLEEAVTDNPRFQAMIELGIFLAAAEYAKRHIFARRMYEDVKSGYAAVCALKFKKTIIAVTQILVNDYGVSRDQISLIWGGGQTQLTAKQKLKQQVKANMAVFEQAGISMEDMMLEEVEDREIVELDASLRLGNQSKDDRQKEIDKFQSGKSLYCMFTYKAGGVGLSLHHTDEMTTQWNTQVAGYEEWIKEIEEWNSKRHVNEQVKPGKVRRQKNGYAVIDDIKFIPTRPRKVTIGPTWSPIELVQGAGRAPRLTSLSDTIQGFLYFRGTVEEDQAFVVTHRLRCLGKVVRQHENWMDLIAKHEKAKEIAKALVDEMKGMESDEPPIGLGDTEDTDE